AGLRCKVAFRTIANKGCLFVQHNFVVTLNYSSVGGYLSWSFNSGLVNFVLIFLTELHLLFLADNHTITDLFSPLIVYYSFCFGYSLFQDIFILSKDKSHTQNQYG